MRIGKELGTTAHVHKSLSHKLEKTFILLSLTAFASIASIYILLY